MSAAADTSGPRPPRGRSSTGLTAWLRNKRASVRFDFPGPIFQREMLGSQRKKWAFVSRMLYVLVFAAILWGVYSVTKGAAERGYSAVGRIQSLQSVAPSLTVAVLITQTSLLTLLAPGLTAGAMSDERRKRTLDVLLTSPIRPWQIVMGKLTASVTTLGVLALCALPVLLAVRIFGGIEAKFIIASFVIALAAATLAAALSLMNSFWCKRASTAQFLAFIFFAVLQGVPVAVAMVGMWAQDLFRGAGPPVGNWAFISLFCSAPMSVVAIVTEILGETIPIGIPNAWILGVVYNLAVAAIIVVFCTLMLRRLMLRLAAGDAPAVVYVGRKPIGNPKGEKPAAADAASEEKRAEPETFRSRKISREVADHPVLWRELAQPLFRKPLIGILAILAMAAFTLFVYAMVRVNSFSGDAEGHTMFTNGVFAFIMLLQATTLTTGGFPTEREAKTWEVLLTSPLRAGDLVIGKYAGALRSMWLMPAALLVNLGLLGIIAGHVTPVTLPLTIAIFTGPLLFIAALGIRFSVAAKTANAAGVRVTGISLGLWAGLPLIGGLGHLLLDAYQIQSSLLNRMLDLYMDVVLWFNPFYNFLMALEVGTHVNRGQHLYELGRPDGGGWRVEAGGYFLFMSVVSVAYIVAAAALLRWSMVVFNKKSGRSS